MKLEALATKLDLCNKNFESRLNTTENRIDVLEVDMKDKISKSTASLAIGIMVTILMAMFGWISIQIADMQKTTSSTNQDVASIKGKLEPYNIEFSK